MVFPLAKLNHPCIMERLGNLANFYRAQGEDAIAAYNRGDFEECDSACFELLQKSDLPPIWRAECNYLLGTSTSSTAVVYAAEAVRRYQILSARDPESSYLREALGEAQLSLTAAQQESTLPTGNEIDESQDDLDEAEDCDGRSQETDDDESEDGTYRAIQVAQY